MYIFKDSGYRFEYEKGQHYIYIYNDYKVNGQEIDVIGFDFEINKTNLTKKDFLEKCNRYLKERGIENEY
jgi:hypothetical protein